MSFIEVSVPVTGDRYLKMFWTCHRTSPTGIRWRFPSDWECARALRYLTSEFKFRDEICVQRNGLFIEMNYKKGGGSQ